MKQLFPMGRLLATPPAMEALARNGQTASEFLDKHMTGDWGGVDKDDAATNEAALKDGSRIFSAYRLQDGITKIWVITEAVNDKGSRASTCLMLPEDY